ncbi:MAG: hypothetical protein HYV63_23310 [Candidatus Schekmanbacteria bacterium]|nr:hypothetical protein [Candidatus Schekmanbacteria bacterium]
MASAEKLEDAFAPHQGGAWGSSAAARLDPLLDDAAREYAEQVHAYRALQKAETDRARAADEARRELVSFRRVVRVIFGRKSREYRDLADRRHTGEPAAAPGAQDQPPA